MANLTLREGRATPLSVQEVDDNFTALNTDKLEVSEFSAANILTKLLTVDGSESQLDADLVDGLSPTAANQSLTLVSRDASGNFAANVITANIIGNVTAYVTDSFNYIRSLQTSGGLSSGANQVAGTIHFKLTSSQRRTDNNTWYMRVYATRQYTGNNITVSSVAWTWWEIEE